METSSKNGGTTIHSASQIDPLQHADSSSILGGTAAPGERSEVLDNFATDIAPPTPTGWWAEVDNPMMKLADLRHTTTYFLFDPADGTVEEFQRSGDVEISGFYEQTDAGWVAIHPDPEGRTLLVQIDGTSWDLFAAETHVGYKHDYETPRTTFTIEDDEKRLRRTYDPWWDEPGCEWFEPEPWSAGREQENWEEDIFGYVWWLSQQEERKEDFVQPWAENMTGDSGDAAGEEND